MSEVEYQGIKVKGGKLFLIFPLLGTLGGAIWAGFEGYARWVSMEKKINEYVAPDLSGFNLKLDVLEERIISLEDNMGTELRSVKELVGAAQDDARTIRIDLRKDINEVQDQVAASDRRSRNMDQEVRASLRQTETDLRTMIDHASDRFDNKRTAIESDAVRRGEVIDIKLKELEDRIIKLLERALNNPLAGQ
tara:strand:+ start:1121 stop:1699 length:579 start_codon:yes stop_codon:yes gene_type:complete